MVDVYEPLACAQGVYNGALVWAVRLRRPDGTTGTHAFPAHTPHCRAAEYGIAADDIATLLDVILHEPYLPPGDDPDIYAMPIEDARTMHLARIAHTKTHRVVIDHTHPVFGAFHDGHGVTPEAVATLSADVASLRAHVAARPRALAPRPVLQLPRYSPPARRPPPTHRPRTDQSQEVSDGDD